MISPAACRPSRGIIALAHFPMDLVGFRADPMIWCSSEPIDRRPDPADHVPSFSPAVST
jgi:hypothetical protein